MSKSFGINLIPKTKMNKFYKVSYNEFRQAVLQMKMDYDNLRLLILYYNEYYMCYIIPFQIGCQVFLLYQTVFIYFYLL